MNKSLAVKTYSICDFLLVNFIVVACSTVCVTHSWGFRLRFFDFFFSQEEPASV